MDQEDSDNYFLQDTVEILDESSGTPIRDTYG